MHARPAAVREIAADYICAPAAVVRFLFVADAIAATSIAAQAVHRKRGVATKGRPALGTKRASVEGNYTPSAAANIAPGTGA
jgi:hypothetical protein